MELRVNDYVRTKNGLIAKIININDFREPSLKYGIEANYIVDIGFIGDEDIKISSPNIIDLIEKEDLVEIEYYSERYDERVTRLFIVETVIKKDISFHNSHCQLNIFDGEWANYDKHLKPIIKSIVTHEQFKKREFKVGE